ncbi:MAG: T9SS type A sorting domain-containing protein [candidate division Zixibacteria bacterium]|nr:T9SS type A sorting domain-containing protein [candidate division Zixibacteria bacterium]
MYRQLIIHIAVITLLVLSFSPVTATDLVKTQEFTIPDISTISDYSFGFFDDDSTPELLVRSDNQLLLYSISGDSLLYNITLPTALNYKIALGDVNQDDITEIIVAMSFDITTSSDSAAVIELYTIYGSLPIESIYFNNYEYTNYNVLAYEPVIFDCLKTVDLDMDGKTELIFSHHIPIYYYDLLPTIRKYFGQTIIYNNFPSDTLVRSYRYLSDPVYLYEEDKSLLLGSEDRIHDEMPSYMYHIGLRNSATTRIVIYNCAEQLFQPIGRSCGAGCSGFFTDGFIAQKLEILCVGDIDTTVSEYQALLSFEWQTRCEPDNQPVYGEQGHEWYYVNLVGDSDYTIRSTLYPQDFSHFTFHPNYPGTYFAFSEGAFRHLVAGTLTEIQILPTVPDGVFDWKYPYDNTTPHLVSVNNNTVAIYHLLGPTSVDDDDVPLPSTFSIGPLRPNPFNASQSIMIRTAVIGKPVNLSVYDILGKKVAVLFDGIWNNLENELVWDASALPTGVYFIRAQSGGEVHVVKSMLLK